MGLAVQLGQPFVVGESGMPKSRCGTRLTPSSRSSRAALSSGRRAPVWIFNSWLTSAVINAVYRSGSGRSPPDVMPVNPAVDQCIQFSFQSLHRQSVMP